MNHILCLPTESSLDELDGFAAEISRQIAALDDEISEVVQVQSLAGRQLTKVRVAAVLIA